MVYQSLLRLQAVYERELVRGCCSRQSVQRAGPGGAGNVGDRAPDLRLCRGSSANFRNDNPEVKSPVQSQNDTSSYYLYDYYAHEDSAYFNSYYWSRGSMKL